MAAVGRPTVYAARQLAADIFCGHFPDQAYTFTEEEAADGSRGAWYVRQLIGAANIEGNDSFHLMSGNLSYQVEHLFRTCGARFLQQWLAVQRTILRLAFPGGEFRPQAPPYVAPPVVEDPGPVVANARAPIPAFP